MMVGMHEAEASESPAATNAGIRAILARAKTIAVVGLSDKPERESHHVAAYLQSHGYRIIPVNPNAAEILGERAYASLREVPVPVDVVDIFRQPAVVPAIVAEAIAIGAKVVWMQEGIVHETAAEAARTAGLTVVMDRCLLKEHRRLTP
jgi:predicted CoA-binding protein